MPCSYGRSTADGYQQSPIEATAGIPGREPDAMSEGEREMRVLKTSPRLKIGLVVTALFSYSPAFSQSVLGPKAISVVDPRTGTTGNKNCIDCIPVYGNSVQPDLPVQTWVDVAMNRAAEFGDDASIARIDYKRSLGNSYRKMLKLNGRSEALVMEPAPQAKSIHQPVYPRRSGVVSSHLRLPETQDQRVLGDEGAYPLKNTWEEISHKYDPDQILRIKLPPLPISPPISLPNSQPVVPLDLSMI